MRSGMTASVVLVLVFASPLLSFDEKAAAEDKPVLQDEKAKNSYAVGMQVGGKLKGSSLDLDADLVARGLKDALTGAKTLLTEEEMNAGLKALQANMRTNQQEAAKQAAEKNKKEGEAFLAENKTKEGVVTLESGLQYKVLKAGNGKKPTANDTVICRYRGTLIDGTEFDSSYGRRRRPTTFSLKSVIPGWSEALQLMPVGSKWQIFIPPSLAYGETGPRGPRPSKIGPNATLIFELDLLTIQDTVAKETAANSAAAAAAKTGIQVSFKLDPRITKAMYMGERWVSPPTYTTTLDTVEARVAGVDSKGVVKGIRAKWTPSDPEMVTVSPSEGNEVKIAVRRPGQTTVHLSSGGISKELAIKAALQNNVMLVEIAQQP